MNNEIGIITYHSAYNYGSVLQTFATLKTVKQFGYPVNIINYRMQEQKRFYAMYKRGYGKITFIKDLLQFPVHSKRLSRKQAFENFYSEYYNLTEETDDPETALSYMNRYSIMISGSDQIWNKHSCELEHVDWKYMDPYLLKNYRGKKISYASSVSNMTDNDIKRILPQINEFDYISVRESSSVNTFSRLTGKDIQNVLDPTFLLSKDEWIKVLNLQKQNHFDDYILYYSLKNSIKETCQDIKVLEKLSERYNCNVKMITPFVYVNPKILKSKNVQMYPELGPIEFLNAIYNAKYVITDSYHGTVLSANFGKDFYSICLQGGSEFRKTDILNQLGLTPRIISGIDKLADIELEPIDYVNINVTIDELREKSKKYLLNSINN